MQGSKPSTLAERLDWLFNHVKKPDGKPYTYQEVADGTAELGYRVTSTGIWKIRNGETQNPGYLVLQVLAQFFKVSPSFFYDEQLSPHDLDTLHLVDLLQKQGVGEIALRSSELPPSGREAVLQILRYMQEQADSVDNESAE